MTRQFKPVRSFVLIGLAAFIVCGVAVFYSHRTAHGRRAAYDGCGGGLLYGRGRRPRLQSMPGIAKSIAFKSAASNFASPAVSSTSGGRTLVHSGSFA